MSYDMELGEVRKNDTSTPNEKVNHDVNHTLVELVNKGDTSYTTPTSISQWKWCRKNLPKEEIVFFAQIFPLYIVIIWCMINLSTGHGDDHTSTVLLGSCLGYLLLNPTLSKKTKK